jgi:hypothetical protein
MLYREIIAVCYTFTQNLYMHREVPSAHHEPQQGVDPRPPQ